MLGACGFSQTRVAAVGHEYEGLPATLPAGTTALTFVNEGEEQHMIGLVRVNDGGLLSRTERCHRVISAG
ncbi:MAG: hypothetical protein L0H64_14955 [Pseudonocardia sp.]|nr:hypothetical protein [Pseudonocardia sp.]